jgi:hypothetical protein
MVERFKLTARSGATPSQVPDGVIARAEAHNLDELGKRVQAVDGITRTLTCPVVHLP